MHFRPDQIPMGDDDPGGPVEWEDNAISNTMAWFSHKVLPNWCQTPEHWTSRVTQYLFTDCPCCILFRGITVGMLIQAPVILALLFMVVFK